MKSCKSFDYLIFSCFFWFKWFFVVVFVAFYVTKLLVPVVVERTLDSQLNNKSISFISLFPHYEVKATNYLLNEFK